MRIDYRHIVMLGIATILMIGCTKESSPSISHSDKKEYVFALIAKNQGNPVFQAARTGAEDAGAI